MVERDLAKVDTRVRFPSLAPVDILPSKYSGVFFFPNHKELTKICDENKTSKNAMAKSLSVKKTRTCKNASRN